MKKMITLLAIASFSCGMVGCANNTERTTQVTTTGEDWAEVRTTQEYPGKHGKRIKEKQVVKEKITCVNKKGEAMHVNSIEECMKRKGKIVDEVDTIETRTVR